MLKRKLNVNVENLGDHEKRTNVNVGVDVDVNVDVNIEMELSGEYENELSSTAPQQGQSGAQNEVTESEKECS